MLESQKSPQSSVQESSCREKELYFDAGQLSDLREELEDIRFMTAFLRHVLDSDANTEDGMSDDAREGRSVFLMCVQEKIQRVHAVLAAAWRCNDD